MTKVTLNKELLNNQIFTMYSYVPIHTYRLWLWHFFVWEMENRKNPSSYYLIPFMTATYKSSV